MSKYTSFQCPLTGQTVTARYAFGRLSVKAITDDDVAAMLSAETKADTLTWCKRHDGKRFKTFGDANEYLIDIAEGQAPWGME